MAVSSLLEILSLVIVALLITVVFAFEPLTQILRHIFGGNFTLLLLIIGVGIAVVLTGIFILREKIYAFLQSCGVKKFFLTVLMVLFKYMLALAALGLVMVILYAYTGHDVGLKNGLWILSGYNIAWLLGFVTPGAAGGIGVRELAVSMLLTPVMGQELTLTLSIIHRLITIIGDFLLYPISFWKSKM